MPAHFGRRSESIEQIPVEAPVLDGLKQVVGGDRIRAGQVGDRPRDLEDAVVGAGGYPDRIADQY